MDAWEIPQSSRSDLDGNFLMDALLTRCKHGTQRRSLNDEDFESKSFGVLDFTFGGGSGFGWIWRGVVLFAWPVASGFRSFSLVVVGLALQASVAQRRAVALLLHELENLTNLASRPGCREAAWVLAGCDLVSHHYALQHPERNKPPVLFVEARFRSPAGKAAEVHCLFEMAKENLDPPTGLINCSRVFIAENLRV